MSNERKTIRAEQYITVAENTGRGQLRRLVRAMEQTGKMEVSVQTESGSYTITKNQ